MSLNDTKQSLISRQLQQVHIDWFLKDMENIVVVSLNFGSYQGSLSSFMYRHAVVDYSKGW